MAEHVRARLPHVAVDAVTGELAPEERLRRVDALGSVEAGRVLVATDCLSEGINLQEYFDAVVHYDLSWNPTRHEQREGRADRYGQTSPVVRSTLIYGENNPIDGAVLQVILRKAESIRKELGVPVPLPDDDHSLTEALMQSVLFRRGGRAQRDLFDFDGVDEAHALDLEWTNVAERAKRNRTVFAQRRLKPEQVLPEWQRMQAALGAQSDVRRFVERAMARLNAGLEPHGRSFRAPLGALPAALSERLAAEGWEGTIAVDFNQPATKGARFIHRSHPLVGALADDLLERALAESDSTPSGFARLGRAGVWRTSAVLKQTTVLLLRLRHQLTTTTVTAAGRPGRSSVLLVEEALPIALVGRQSPTIVVGDEAAAWLGAPVAGDLPEHARRRVLDEAFSNWQALQIELAALAARQAESLLADHRRVREAAEARGRYDARPLTPVDVVAAYVLLPVG